MKMEMKCFRLLSDGWRNLDHDIDFGAKKAARKTISNYGAVPCCFPSHSKFKLVRRNGWCEWKAEALCKKALLLVCESEN